MLLTEHTSDISASIGGKMGTAAGLKCLRDMTTYMMLDTPNNDNQNSF